VGYFSEDTLIGLKLLASLRLQNVFINPGISILNFGTLLQLACLGAPLFIN